MTRKQAMQHIWNKGDLHNMSRDEVSKLIEWIYDDFELEKKMIIRILESFDHLSKTEIEDAINELRRLLS